MKDAFAEIIGDMLRCACVVIAFVLLPGCIVIAVASIFTAVLMWVAA